MVIEPGGQEVTFYINGPILHIFNPVLLTNWGGGLEIFNFLPLFQKALYNNFCKYWSSSSGDVLEMLTDEA